MNNFEKDQDKFWQEDYKSVLLLGLENFYKPEIIKEWSAQDFVVNKDKVLVKWMRRHRPLTDEEYKLKYNK